MDYNETFNWFLNLTAAERKSIVRAARILRSAGFGDMTVCVEAIYYARKNNGRDSAARRAVVVAR